MPLTVEMDNQTQKYRLMDSVTGKVAVNENGTAYDGGGHDFESTADRQLKYVDNGREQKLIKNLK